MVDGSTTASGATTGTGVAPTSSTTAPGSTNGVTNNNNTTTSTNASAAATAAAAAVAAAAIVQENVAELQFGSEFEDILILSNAQVAVILQESANTAVTRDEELNEVYRKTQRYVNRFNSMTNPEKAEKELIDELDNLAE